MLPVKSMPASVEFYQKLGFAVERRHDEWGWAMLRCDDCRLMLDQSINVHPNAPRQAVIYLYPENVAEFHAQARAKEVNAPALSKTFYGMTEFRIEDPDGNQLWIGQAC
jgi:catechol 2,3-dioxygenase-like lactoylglutathione lyase family enzyme